MEMNTIWRKSVRKYNCYVQPWKTSPLKLKSEILKDKNSKTISIEEFVYNDFCKVVRQDFKDANGSRQFYKTFDYDGKGNCIKTFEFSDNDEIQASFEYTYDNNDTQVKAIERTAEGNIWKQKIV